ncbi:MAG: ComF family protein [Syntrophales bacterium]|nr:ComF family protein [Syntrophales bacterium]
MIPSIVIENIRKSVAAIIEVVYPRRCFSCGAQMSSDIDQPFCINCIRSIKIIGSPICLRCGLPFESSITVDHLCSQCVSKVHTVDEVRSLCRYEGTFLKLIHDFKYRGNTILGSVLGEWLATNTYPHFSIEEYEVIIPVPLHRWRLYRRGFNQAVILARAVADRFGIPLDFEVLVRRRHGEPQTSLDRKARRQNVKGVFEVLDGSRICGSKVLLIDDVYTTGSTLEECAKVLKAHGVRKVGALTLARVVS